ncbi:MAG: carboxypeptidase-like regulatory domain-containing protein [Thermoplasmatota archaeon]
MHKWNTVLISMTMLAAGILIDFPGSGEETRTPGGILYVSPSGSTYNEVQWAVDNATEGDTIYVAPGNYSEGMVIRTNGISVIGNSSQGEVRIGKFDMGVAAVNANWVNISGVNITDEFSHLGLLAVTSSGNISLTDVTLFSGNLSDGLFVTGSSGIRIHDMDIQTDLSLPLGISGTTDLEMIDFSIRTAEWGTAVETGGDCELSFIDGEISMRNVSARAFGFQDMTDAIIDNVSALYPESGSYLLNGEGDVRIHDVEVPEDDIDGGSGQVSVLFGRKVTISYVDRTGEQTPAPGADLNHTISSVGVYVTPHYGGWDERSDENGTFPTPLNLLSRRYEGGAAPVYGSNHLKAWYMRDHEQEIDLGLVDANTTDDIHILFDGVCRSNGTISGRVRYERGPLDGLNVSGGEVELHGWDGETHEDIVPDESGSFVVSSLAFQNNITIAVHPPADRAYIEENRSGYLTWTSSTDFLDDLDLDIGLQYMEFTPPTNGTLSGVVTYSGGPSDGLNATDATVIVLNASMERIANTTVDEEGGYGFPELPFGENYTIRVLPDNGVETGSEVPGYVPFEMVFHHDRERELDIEIEHWVPPDEGPVFGWVRYQEGPKDGDFVPNASVVLYDMDGAEVDNISTDMDGYFIFEEIPFGVGYELRISPPPEDAGINNQETGYLFWDGSAFPHNGSTRMNASLKYYRRSTVHPEIIILDESGDPLEGVFITARVEDESFTAETNESGKAVFTGYDGAEFPQGTRLEAVKPGFDKENWEWGKSAPKMKEADGYDNTLIFILIAILVIVVILGALIGLFMGRTKEEILEE